MSLISKLLAPFAGGFWLYAAVFALGAAVGGIATHKADAAHYGAQIQEGRIKLADEKAAHAADLKAVSDAAAKAASAALLAQQNMQHQLAALDARHSQEMKNAQSENDRLRRAVDDGRVRLRIAVEAARAAGGNAVPGNSGAPGVDDGTPAELAPSARRAYFALRDALTKAQGQIEALQDYVRNVCLAPH
ncbi:lysis protein [Burkholderia cenocepacia]|uniref:lysis protein n=1 Tax=Burkholderia cenocepacia TaxID=95486 RepID=UPI00264EEC52|nr:lysis protein [Burkholderia cenocepacia]MDN7541939.1 lysis protein [Burkholderia cenocepacia]